MKFAQIAIGSILFIEAVLLLYSPQERYNLHSLIQFIQSQYQDCSCLQNITFEFIQNIRYFVVALIITGAYSLTLGNNIIVGIFAQLFWIVTQTQLYNQQGIKEIRNTLVQFLFLIVLLGEMRNEWAECKKKKNLQKRKKQQAEKQNIAKQQSQQAKQSSQPAKVNQTKKQAAEKGKKEQSKKSR